MKVKDIINESEKRGTYAGVHFSDKTKKAINEFMKDNNISNPVKPDKLHTTLLYSRKYLSKYKPAGELEEVMIGKPDKFEIWPAKTPDDDGKVAMYLVLIYDCPELTKRHKSLMDEHDATYDFPSYIPHITFSYDVGEIKCKDIPNFNEDIEIVSEYGEDLELP